MDVRFNHLESLHWLWLVLGVAVAIVIGFALKRRDLARFADTILHARLLPMTSFGRHYAKAVLLLLALGLLVAALLDPRWGVTYRQVQQRGIDLVFVLDVSRSMLARDARPDRLRRARQYISDLLDQLGGDRVALVTFAGTASIKCPLTVDYGALRLALATTGPRAAAREGSVLGDALRVAGAAFTDDVPDHKAIIVFTDGEDHGSYPIEAARQLAQDRSVPIYTIGIGDRNEGSRIPVEDDGMLSWLTYQGQEVWSKMDASVLAQIAVATGGAFIPVGTGTVDIGRLYAERIEPVAKREYETASIRHVEARYQWFAGLALLVLLVESFTSDRRSNGERRS